MSFIPKSQEIYKHFKGNLYQVTAVAEHTETGEQLVIYQALYGDFKIYARPLSMFISRVDRTKYPDAEQEFRFELQGPEADRQWAETGPKEGQPEMTAGPGSREAAHGIGMAGAGAAVGDTGTTDGAGAEDGAGARTASDGELDPLVLEFLDARSYEERLKILSRLRPRITDSMINVMSVAVDVEVKDGSTEERFDELRSCLSTRQRYESRGSRLR